MWRLNPSRTASVEFFEDPFHVLQQFGCGGPLSQRTSFRTELQGSHLDFVSWLRKAPLGTCVYGQPPAESLILSELGLSPSQPGRRGTTPK